MDISFSINNQTITRTDKNNVVSGSKNYLFATFTFSDDWKNKIKTAQFTRGETVIDMLLVNDRCAVPWELLQRGGAVNVTVFGGDLITVNSAAVHIAQSGYSVANTPALLPTPNYYAQVVQALGVPGPQGETGPQGPQGPQGDQGLDGSAVPIDDASTAADRVLSASYIKGQLADKVQYFKLKNEVVKGDFSQGTAGFLAEQATLAIVNGEGEITSNTVGGTAYGLTAANLTLFSNRKYYISYKIKPFRTHKPLIWAGVAIDAGKTVTAGVMTNVSYIFQPPANRNSVTIYGNSGQTTDLIVGSKVSFDNIIIIDITSIFGLGNEPTKLEMDELMKVIPNQWWDGELSLTQKQVITWQLNLIRKNTNAIIAIGGTIV